MGGLHSAELINFVDFSLVCLIKVL